jgi:preprotein translocase subunit SecY
MAASEHEDKMEKKHHEERQQMLALGIGVLQSLASAFTGNNNNSTIYRLTNSYSKTLKGL